jgi:hypothetical protein
MEEALAKHLMTKEEYADRAIQLTARCKIFTEETCHQWRVEAPGNEVQYDATAWEDLREVREVYFTLET